MNRMSWLGFAVLTAMILLRTGSLYAQVQTSQILLTKESQNLFTISAASLEKLNLESRLGSVGVTRKMAIEVTMKHQKWLVDEIPSGVVHSIDMVYGDEKKEQYASVQIAELNAGNRAGTLLGMTIVVPYSIDMNSGMFFSFCKSVEDGKQLVSECPKEFKFVANYSKCEKERNICTVLFKDMQITQADGRNVIDIKSAVLGNDDIVLGFIEPEGPRLVPISLLGFQAAYKH